MKTAFISTLIFLFVSHVVLLTVAIADITKPEKPLSANDKKLWVIVFLILPIVGPFLYFIFIKTLKKLRGDSGTIEN